MTLTPPSIADLPHYGEMERLHLRLRNPGSGFMSDGADLDISADGRSIVFTGFSMESLCGAPVGRICIFTQGNAVPKPLTDGARNDRNPRISPDGRHVAYLSDRDGSGRFQLSLLDLGTGSRFDTAEVPGWVEYFHWSGDSQELLCGIADPGADTAAGQGSKSPHVKVDSSESWEPHVDTGVRDNEWRHVAVYSLADDRFERLPLAGLNIWEACWCGRDGIALLASRDPSEGAWYDAAIHRFDLRTAETSLVYQPDDQLGWLNANPSGRTLAFVEAVCSDRGIVAGRLKIIDVTTGKISAFETDAIDVSTLQWVSDSEIFIAGLRTDQTCAGYIDINTRNYVESWASEERTTSGHVVRMAAACETREIVLIAEGFVHAPELAIIKEERYFGLYSFDLSGNHPASLVVDIRTVRWLAADQLELQGWRLTPAKGAAPFPTVVCIHGGPVAHWRPTWLGRAAGVPLIGLLERGYAIFLPNPRGSSGRGRAFAQAVVGDMGGGDAGDILTGVDDLVKSGFADSDRLGLTGGSYGGYMTAWLVTQTERFAAACPIVPFTNQVTAQLVSNIPWFYRSFVADDMTNLSGRYMARSPISFASAVSTPVLTICGAHDRCTPPVEALQFHRAVLANGTASTLVTYPEEGHGIRNFPAAIDFAARFVGWFAQHMPSDAKRSISPMTGLHER